MQDETVLQRFKRFKALVVSSNIPGSMLLDIAEKYITSNDSDYLTAESVPVMEGQLTLFDVSDYKELVNA